MSKENNKDEFIRDVCSVTPLPKSEVRRRLNEIIQKERQRICEELEGRKVKEGDLYKFDYVEMNEKNILGVIKIACDIRENVVLTEVIKKIAENKKT